jgi:molybdopterin-containing oxidoreductase family iron-sulfur binding subunit
MAVDRRAFLRISSLATVGVAGGRWLLAAPARIKPDDLAPRGQALKAGRWALVIDIKKCLESDIRVRCVKACHQVHNVPDFRNPDGSPDRKNEIKWIWEEPYPHVFPSQYHEYLASELSRVPVLTLCNHCANPPCVRVCPTQATFRRNDGIVAMDSHRCIGCRFCIAACPYGSRSFNWKDPRPHIKEITADFPTRTKGVVEKCSFCSERLVEGKLPACVEAAGDSGSLVFGDLHDKNSKVRQVLNARYTIRRKPELGTEPAVFYVV